MATRSFTTFHLNDQLFGLDILLVREINRHLELTPVPQAPDYIRGLINLRGQIVTVLDLKRRLGLETTDQGAIRHNIILKTDAELTGQGNRKAQEEKLLLPDKVSLLVDAIGDVITVDEDAIDPPPANVDQLEGKYLTGVIRLDGTLLTLLNLNTVLKGDLSHA